MLGDLTLAHFALIAAAALGAQIIGGLAGYGTGLLMPLVLVPLLGAEAVVPVITLSSLITNPTRVIAFRYALDLRKAAIVTLAGLPTVGLGAWGFTLLTGRGAAILIGLVLIVIVPVRRLLKRLEFRLGERGLGVSGILFGLVMGGTSGSGVILLALLMASGLSGVQVVATDAAITFVLGLIKAGVFVGMGALPAHLWAVAVLIGVMATPGTLAAKWLARRLSPGTHDVLIEAAILIGGGLLIWRAVVG